MANGSFGFRRLGFTSAGTVNAQYAQIRLSDPALAFSAAAGGGNPASQQIIVYNDGTGAFAGLTVAKVGGAAWLTTSVSVNFQGLTVVTVSPATGALTAATYNETLQISDPNAPNSPQVCQISFTVTATSTSFGIAVLPTGITWNSGAKTFDGTVYDTTTPAYFGSAPNTSPANSAAFTTALTTQASQNNYIIHLTAGTTYTGSFQMPVRTGTGFCIIRSANYASLPARGTRVAPSDSTNMAQITNASLGAGNPIKFAKGANDYWFTGLQFTQAHDIYFMVDMIDQFGSPNFSKSLGDIPRRIVFDRCLFSGTANMNCMAGIKAVGINLSVEDCYFDELHNKTQASGGGLSSESQAINTVFGPGPYKIINCHLGAAGENFMSGAADMPIDDASWVPQDIEIRRCHMRVPDRWNKNSSSYAGVEYIIKNTFELKSAVRMLVDGCILEGSIGGYSQNGEGFVIKTGRGGSPPFQQNYMTRDITIAYCEVRNCESGITMVGTDRSSGVPEGVNRTDRVTIKHILFRNLNKPPYRDVTGATSNPAKFARLYNNIQNLEITNLTAEIENNGLAPPGSDISSMVNLDNSGVSAEPKAIQNLTWQDNVIAQCRYGLNENRGLASEGTPCLNLYTTSYTWTGNVQWQGNGTGSTTSTNYPSGNFFPATVNNVGFAVSPPDAVADFIISGTYAGKGADIATIQSHTSGVASP